MSDIKATFGLVETRRFTALTEDRGNSAAVTAPRSVGGHHDRRVRRQLVKARGDAAIVIFPEPVAAVAAVSRLFATPPAVYATARPTTGSTASPAPLTQTASLPNRAEETLSCR